MKILVAGGRDYTDNLNVESKLDQIKELYKIELICTGGAKGVDRFADKWAEIRGIPRCIWPANWKGEGNGAGPLRNLRMVEFIDPDLIVLFPGGTGTANMAKIATQLEIKKIVIKK